MRAAACDHKRGEGKTSARPTRLAKRRVDAYAEQKGIDADDEWPRNALAVNLHFCFKRKEVEFGAALL